MPLLRQIRRTVVSVVLLTPALLEAQARDSARVIAPDRPASWHLQTSTYYSSADNGYGVWTGQDARLLYSGKRVSPFLSLGSQQRPEGHQEAVGLGSYVNLTKWAYAIVGIGTAPDRGTVLFPRIRSDATLFLSVPKMPGVLVSTGFTDLRYSDKRAGGRIISVGPTVYRGRGIYNGAVFFNEDRASGARSHAWQAGGQWGTQGRFWIGGGVGAGNEAYRLLAATPFDARFQSRFASAFVSKWVTKRSGVSVRLDYENKVDVFQRRAIGLTYFVDF
ncbi:MAG: YaiO family outer membrane beta-barrel protein [Gemmatimonadaceae bacterium]|nr:YaiO family outer membrane beta-barrel protein [Gemmatimonadaceae bacterium]